MKRILFVCLTVVLAGLLSQPATAADSYVFTPLSFPGAGVYLTTPTGISNNGTVVGWYRTSIDYTTHGFVYSGGQFTTLDFPGEPITYIYAISHNGNFIVGAFDSCNCGYYQGFVYSDGQFKLLDPSGSSGSYNIPNGVNDSGEVVGSTGGFPFLYSGGQFTILYPPSNPSGPIYNFGQAYAINDNGLILGAYGNSFYYGSRITTLYSGGQFTELNLNLPPAGILLDNTSSPSINDGGQISGVYQIQYPVQNYYSGDYSFVYNGGQLATINVSSCFAATYAANINASAQVVGFADFPPDCGRSSPHAFLYSTGVITDLDSYVIHTSYPGSTAIAINDAGQIIGTFSSSYGINSGFILTPAQTISFGTAPTVLVGGIGMVSATGGSSGNPVTFTSQTPAVCTVSGNTVTGVTAGACIIAADQSGTANIAAATETTQSFSIFAPCGNGVSLTPNQWQMLSAPCSAYVPETISGTFGSGATGNLNMSNYNNGTNAWVLYTRNAAAAGSGGTYVLSTSTDSVAPGTGYWLESKAAPVGGGKLTVSGTATQAVTGLTGCTSSIGCVAVPVTTVAGQNRYNLVGNPFPYNVAWADVRVLVDNTTVYTPTQAQAAGIIANTIWIWNGTSYDTYSDNAPTQGNLQYSTAFWVNVLPGASVHTVKLLIPAHASLSLMTPQQTDSVLKTESVLAANAVELTTVGISLS